MLQTPPRRPARSRPRRSREDTIAGRERIFWSVVMTDMMVRSCGDVVVGKPTQWPRLVFL